MVTCSATTSSGTGCRVPAGPSGYCHLHDPSAVASRKEARAAEARAREQKWEKGKRLREVVELIQGVARSRGWDSWAQHVDEDNWRYATVVVERYVPGNVLGAKVAGAIEVALEGGLRWSSQRTSGHSFGFSELSASVNEAIRALPWLKPKVTPQETSPEPATPEPKPETAPPPTTKRVFIVHGHDNGTKEEVARFLGKIGLEPIILHEQSDRGRTIIEKLEGHDDVSFAVALLTPDDSGTAKREPDAVRDRARQNVIFEFGYFVAKLGRKNACALVKDGVEIPSDYSGVLYIPMDSGGAWRFLLIRELRAAGFDVDANLAL